MTCADGNRPAIGDVIECVNIPPPPHDQMLSGKTFTVLDYGRGEVWIDQGHAMLFKASRFKLIRRAAAATTTKGK